MKKLLGWLIIVVAVTVLATASCGAESAAPGKPEDGEAEWTVLFYFCGADLESRYGYASLNLDEISRVGYPYDFMPMYLQDEYTRADMLREDVGRVNILFETGGTFKWNTNRLGIEINPNALQRWRCEYYPGADGKLQGDKFQLMETLPLWSMADAETLSDFIRWGAETCPAKKYALVIWGHGNGGKTGLLIDEQFDNDILCLYELKQALADSGVYLEALILDACMMANIETAWNVKDSAHWMIASEESVPGEGTAIREWMQALVNHPTMDGKRLGRIICDTTEMKYANSEEINGEQLLTWSVTDLTKIDRLIAAVGKLVQVMNDAMIHEPNAVAYYVEHLTGSEEFGDRTQDMHDLGSIIYAPTIDNIVDLDLLDEAAEALSEAVVYVTRGNGRSSARGLIFCYPAGSSETELYKYAENFPMPHYLAFLDSISPWTAPDWVYEQTERLPSLDEIDALQVTIEKRMSTSGIPALYFGDSAINVGEVDFNLYHKDEDVGAIVRLGKMDCLWDVKEPQILVRAENPMRWLAIDGQLCNAELIGYYGTSTRIYNIPVQIGTEYSILRCGQTVYEREDDTRKSTYEIYGVWEGYDVNSDLPERSVESLAMLAGYEYRPLYPIEGAADKRSAYLSGRTRTMPRALAVSEISLPAGTYYLEYEVADLFIRRMKLEWIEIHWDGNMITFPEEFVWEGTVETEWEQK